MSDTSSPGTPPEPTRAPVNNGEPACGAEQGGFTCNIPPGHVGRHEAWAGADMLCHTWAAPLASNWPWRQILDRLDAELTASNALADADVLEARRTLGRAIGCLVESETQGRRVTISARTYPPMDENGAMCRPTPAQEAGNHA